MYTIPKVNIPLSIQAFILFVLMVIIALSIVFSARQAMAASLKPISIISDDVLRLGDLFDNIQRNANYVIGPAPQPGQDMTLNARTLYRIAVALDLPWRPSTSYDQITVRRDATIIPYKTIEDTLKEALSNEGVVGRYNISLSNGKPSITLPPTMEQNIIVSGIDFNNRTDYFKATLVSPSTENPIKKITVSGHIERLAQVPVLRNTLKNGDVIGKHDIEMIEVPERKIQHDAIMRPHELVGLTPRRVAYGGKFLLASMLEKPQLVGRGDKVTITFNEGPLILTAKGVALESGAKGDYIRIKNIKSSRTIDATVTAQNQVIAN